MTQTGQEQLEVDEAFIGVGSDSNSETTSISSSIYAGFIENGRRYQTTSEGEYSLPSDEKQWEAEQAGHILSLVLDCHEENPLFRSPISATPKNILDVGTGSGIWAIEVADKYPSATVYGIDLYPPPETWVPPNCRLQVDDAVKEWFYEEKFDLIHMKLLMGSFTDDQWTAVYKQAYNNLAPGGWIEQFESDLTVYSKDGSVNPTGASARWNQVIGGAFAASGKPLDAYNRMEGRIKAAGFTNVQVKTYQVPHGTWAKHPMFKEAGRFNKMQLENGMEGFAMFCLTRFGQPEPWSPEQVHAYLAEVRKELNDPTVHAYSHYRRVFAQKPFEEQK